MQKVLAGRTKLIENWNKIRCPTDRSERLCDLWLETRRAQSRWNGSLVDFVNEPYFEESLRRLLAAGRREEKVWKRSESEISKVQREARDQ